VVPIGGKLGGTTAPQPAYANMAHLCLRLNEPDWDTLLPYLRANDLDPGEPSSRFGADGTGRTSIDWGVYGYPETFVIDRTGRIRYKHIGPIMPEHLAETIRPILESLKQ